MSDYQLSYNAEWDRWIFRDTAANRLASTGDNDVSYELVIRYAYHGDNPASHDDYSQWLSYRFVSWVDGEWYELITQKEMDERRNDVYEHEGEDIAALWAEGQESYIIIRDDHWVFGLRDRFNAMMMLELFRLSVNLREWKSKPLPEKVRKEMDAARDKWQEEEAIDLAKTINKEYKL